MLEMKFVQCDGFMVLMVCHTITIVTIVEEAWTLASV